MEKPKSDTAAPESTFDQKLESINKFLGLPSGEELYKRSQQGQTVTPLELLGAVTRPIESVTAAPARAALKSLQGNLDLSDAMKAFASQFGRNPDTAPTGEELAKGAGLSGKAAAAAGLGLDVAVDPTNLLGMGTLKALPLIGLAGSMAVKKGAKAAEAVSEGSKILAPKGPLGFYSKLEDVLLQKMGKSATPEQIMAIAKGAKEEEVATSGLEAFLKGKQKVGQEEVLQQIRGQRPDIQEVIKSGALTEEEMKKYDELVRANLNDQLTESENLQLTALQRKLDAISTQGPKFAGYVEPGGENYREILITLPNKPRVDTAEGLAARKSVFDKFEPMIDAAERAGQRDNANLLRLQRDKEADTAYNLVADLPKQNEFKSSHWDEPNVLAHARVNERVDEAGNKLFHVEEIQSDWHQAGRQKGYRQNLPEEQSFDSYVKQNYPEKLNEVIELWDDKGPIFKEWENLQWKIINNERLTPDAPFKKSWMEMMAKRMITQAVESGADRLSWTPGIKQAERYALSKSIDAVHAKRQADGLYTIEAYKDSAAMDRARNPLIKKSNLTSTELTETIGKEMADKIMKDLSESKIEKTYSGIELQIGGEGMKGFYDKMLPDFLRKFGKKYGAEVGETTTNGMKVPFLQLTPELKKEVMEKGLPLFQVGGAASLPLLMEKMKKEQEKASER